MQAVNVRTHWSTESTESTYPRSLFLQPTRDDRGWLINPIGRNPWWTALAVAIPALLCTILIFMDQQITAVIINRKEHKLLARKKRKHTKDKNSTAHRDYELLFYTLFYRKAVGTIWTCWWWEWCWLCALSWDCPGSSQPPSCPSLTSTVWSWSQRVQLRESSLASWASESRGSQAWSSSCSWAALYLWLEPCRSVTLSYLWLGHLSSRRKQWHFSTIQRCNWLGNGRTAILNVIYYISNVKTKCLFWKKVN